jgi:hypothetical protein
MCRRAYARVCICCLAIGLVVAASSIASAQTPDPEQIKKELEILKLLKEKAEAEKSIAEAEKAASEARIAGESARTLETIKRDKELAELEKARNEASKAAAVAAVPSSDTKPLEGKTTIDDKVSIEPVVVAHAALNGIGVEIAAEIAAALQKSKSNKVVVYNEAAAQNLWQLRAVMNELTFLNQQLEAAVSGTATGPSLLLLPQLAGAFGRSVSDLVGLFRTDTELKGKDITLNESAIVAAVARELITKTAGDQPIRVFYPSLTPLPGRESSELTRELDRLASSRKRAPGALKKFEEAKRVDDAARLKTVVEHVDRFFTALTTQATGGETALTRALRMEKLLQAATNNAAMLFLKAEAAGGSNIIKSNLWTGSHLTHSAGAAVSYILLDADGAICAARTVTRLTGEQKSKDLVSYTGAR